MPKNKLFTSESVTEGHPDKVCDQISDAVLDDIMAHDKNARVACETVTTTGMVLVMGEISTDWYCDIPSVVRRTLREIGYVPGTGGFDGDTCSVLTAIDEQSPDIALGVDRSVEYKASDLDRYDLLGAGDQGIMFGYACRETPSFMPAAIAFSHGMMRRLAAVRKAGTLPFLRPDGKGQVTVRYDENGVPAEITTVILSTQHTEDVSMETLREAVIEEVIKPSLPAELLKNPRYLVNPTGRFVVGGPQGDSGLTGRKLIVDTYGGYGRHGGGSFSGKDPTKVDRSASYMARYAAKNLVAAGLCDACELEIAYAIGVARPVSISVDCFGTEKIPTASIEKLVAEKVDFRPASIIEELDLRRPIYRQVASYGHFGRDDLDLPWEKLDLADRFR
ncbi:MAG: methionine adenosyltransferase [Clostridia bacterium]|nr:methionine adenosyltransferase [Clostridia bacterium]